MSTQLAIVSMRRTSAVARATVASAAGVLPTATVSVLDVDGSYRPVGAERVLTPDDVGLATSPLHRMAVALEPPAFQRALYPALLRTVADRAGDSTMLAVHPGVIFCSAPTELLSIAAEVGLCLVARVDGPPPLDGRWPGVADLALSGTYAPGLIALRPSPGLLDQLAAAITSSDDGDRWLDAIARGWPHRTLRDPAVLLTPWNLSPSHRLGRVDATGGLSLDGRAVVALDLSRVDPARAVLLNSDLRADPRGRLSDHPALARLVGEWAGRVCAEPAAAPAGSWDPETTSLGTAVDATLRHIYRGEAGDAPDPFDPETRDGLVDWLTAPADGGGPGRYLLALRATRPDLIAAFPDVPGRSTGRYLRWVGRNGGREGYPVALLQRAVGAAQRRRTPRGRAVPGVEVVGYLRGELGIGESARQMVRALAAAGVPHALTPVDTHLLSRQRPPSDAALTHRQFNTTLLCVNADLTPAVAASIPALLARHYRIGMWYWEVEDFPAAQHAGFAHVDEVWVATDFMRRAVEPHSPVPVRTMTPPLPARGIDPNLTKADLGLPDRPVFLFSFDYLSTVERKNPLGLIDAFSRAFGPGEGPVLVIKSLNADQRPREAEEVRMAAANAPDVLLMEEYLDAAERDALVALCDCYVSLHRSEGLGLTMAEAMAWGKPVIATGYSGNLQFMNADNSYLVPWQPTTIPADAAPYPAGGTWADPDLDAAARLMRSVLDEPAAAAQKGARAAADLVALHSAEVAGRRIAARLAETATRRRARSRGWRIPPLRAAARRLRDAVG